MDALSVDVPEAHVPQPPSTADDVVIDTSIEQLAPPQDGELPGSSAPADDQKAEEPAPTEEPAAPEGKTQPKDGEEEEKKQELAEEKGSASVQPEPEAAPVKGDITHLNANSEEENTGRARRGRKTVQRFEVEAPKEQEPTIMEGSGMKLKDIPNVAFKLSKVTGKDELMEAFHNILFRRKGVATTRKKAILDFSGFAFAEGQEEKEMEARKASIGKWKLDLIHKLMDVLDLSRGSGDKQAKIDRVMEFLKAPSKQSDVDLAAKEAKKKEQMRKKREREAAKKQKGVGASTKKQKPAAKKAEAEMEDEEVSEGDDESEEILPSPKERGGRKRQTIVGDEEEEEEEERAAKEDTAMKDAAPGDPAVTVSAEQLNKDMEDVFANLSNEDIQAITGKTAVAKMSEFYGFSMHPRKAEIKEVAFKIIQTRMMPAGDEAQKKTEEPS